MSKGKQTTLFQSWGGKKDNGQKHEKQPLGVSTSIPNEDINAAVIDLCSSFDDDEDDIFLHAEDNVANPQSTGNAYKSPDNEQDQYHECDISVGVEDCVPTQGQSSAQVLPGFDRSAGKLWIYPTNYPVRDYQFNIVQQALYKNTMVTLPTGLGKTFIAAVVMYNYYRWYPQGKVVFMAPTKPLVAQQIEACYNIMGIPQEHTAEMTGSMGPQKREMAWQEKRVFFLTPQVLTNDLSRGSCPGVMVKCLVIDEAHKALGNHAYCQVVRELTKYTENYRVLALSATPGSDIKAVQQVLSNLLISHIEIRTEESIDIKQYSHERKVEKVVVPLGDELMKVKTKYIQIMDAVVRKLKQFGVLYHRDTASLSKFLILKAREGFRQNPPERLQRSQYGIVEGDFAMAMSLYHGYELLQLHGSRSLYNFLQNMITGEKAYGRTRAELTKNADFNELYELLSNKYRVGEEDGIKPYTVGHPKMEKLEEIVLEHFKQSKDGVTRVMIFSQYRDSVQEITDMLHCHQPCIKVMSFIGQASTGKATKGFTQKEQLKVMKTFREGGYNTLVSTCVGEEGLDIGDVDLIICFDAHKSPIRLVQRMGRTGRKREGRIVMLVTQGKEEQIYNQSQYLKRSIHKAILNGARSLHFYQHSPRMVPEDISPAIHKMYITVKEYFKNDKKIASGKNTDQRKAPHALKEATSSVTEEVLTLEEYKELKPWFLPEEQIPRLPLADVICLPPNKEAAPSDTLLSLSEWSPWQNTLQETNTIDHSLDTRHFVELMEFVQLQQSLDPGDDPYGLEMAAYLNEEDILKPGETGAGPGSILKFYQPTRTSAMCHDKSTKRQKDNSKVQSSDAVQSFKDKDDSINFSSDDDLPAFDTGDNFRTLSGGITNNVPKCNDIRDKSNSNSKACERDTSHMTSVQKEKKYCRTESKERLMEKKMDQVRKKRKRWHTSNESVIDIIADTDCNDFDNNPGTVLEDHSIYESGKKVYLNDTILQAPKAVNGTKSPLCKMFINERQSIGPPPPLEEVTEAFHVAENKKSLQIDLLEVLKEWNRENAHGKWINVSQNEDIGSDTSSSSEELTGSVINMINDAKNRTETESLAMLMDLKFIWNKDSKTDIHTKADSGPDCIVSPSLKVENGTKSEKDMKNTPIVENQHLLNSDINADTKMDHKPEHLKTQRDVSNDSDNHSEGSEYSFELNKPQWRNGSDTKAPNEKAKMDTGLDTPTMDQLSAQNSELWLHGSMDESILLRAVKTPHDTNNTNTQVTTPHDTNNTNTQVTTPHDTNNTNTQVTTPHDTNNTNTQVTTPHDTNNTNTQVTTPHDTNNTNTQVTTPHDTNNTNTQVTFTQAFACIQSGSLGSEDLELLDKEHSTNASVSRDSLPQYNEKSGSDGNDSDKRLGGSKHAVGDTRLTDVNLDLNNSDQRVKTLAEKSLSETGTDDGKGVVVYKDAERSLPSVKLKQSSLSDDSVEFADFDLGFDVDDDIIPPSPCASQTCVFKGSRLNQELRGNITQKNLFQETSEQTVLGTEDSVVDSANFIESYEKKKTVLGDKNVSNKSEDVSLDIRNNSEYTDRSSDLNNESKDSKHEAEPSDSRMLCNTVRMNGKENLSTDQIISEGTQSSGGFECASPLFETSFALLDEDLDEWIDSGTTSKHIINCGKKDGDMSDVSKESRDVSLKNKVDSYQWCDNSFSYPNITPARSISKLEPDGWLTSRNNTSTPVMDSSRKVQTVTHFRSFSETPNIPDETDNNDSFIVRRKKKVKIIDFSESENERSPEQATGPERKSENVRTLTTMNCKVVKKKQRFTELLSNDDNFDDSFMLTKNKYIRQKPPPVNMEEDAFSDDDFDEKSFADKEKQSKGKKTKERKQKAVKRSSNPFIDEEAELSEENGDNASSDEEEGSDLDQYDDSFIHDSQFIQSQAMNQTDVQALYLRSVRSPLNNRAGYKLQFNHRNVSVYSQAPPDEESQYMEDSFCVGSEESGDEFDWLALSKDMSHGEVTMLHSDVSTLHGKRPRRKNIKTFQTRREKAIHAGRLRALDEIRAKAFNKNSKPSTCTNTVNAKDKEMTLLPKKNRIKLMEESSSEDNDDSRVDRCKIVSPEVPLAKNKKKRPLILSSSEEEDGAFENNKHNDCGILSETARFQGKTRGPENDFNMSLSLKERIHLNSSKRKRTEETADMSKRVSCHINSEQRSDLRNEQLNGLTKIKSKTNYGENGTKNSTVVENNGGSINRKYENDPNVTSSGVSVSLSVGKAVILVDSKELSGAQHVVSDLRFKHNIHVSAASLHSCDYIISNRMAVERKQWSQFSNGAHRTKLIDRLQHLQNVYERSCLIVEKDGLKSCEEKSKNIHWTKYVYRTCAMLIQSQVKVLFSENQGETAVLLADLCKVELRKNMSITAKVDLNSGKADMLKFYTSLPNVTYINALNFCNRFASVKDLMSSSVSVIEERGKMSKARATDVFNFIRRNFDPQMLPTEYN